MNKEQAIIYLSSRGIDEDHIRQIKEAFSQEPQFFPLKIKNLDMIEQYSKSLKHQLYKRYMYNPTEFKELSAILENVEEVLRHNSEVIESQNKGGAEINDENLPLVIQYNDYMKNAIPTDIIG